MTDSDESQTNTPEFVIGCPPFKMQIGVFRDAVDFQAFFAEREIVIPHISNSNAMAVQLSDPGGCPYFALWIPEDTPVPVIAHECSHLVDFVFHSYGLPTGCKNSELRGHMLEHLLSEIMESVGGVQ